MTAAVMAHLIGLLVLLIAAHEVYDAVEAASYRERCEP